MDQFRDFGEVQEHALKEVLEEEIDDGNAIPFEMIRSDSKLAHAKDADPDFDFANSSSLRYKFWQSGKPRHEHSTSFTRLHRVNSKKLLTKEELIGDFHESRKKKAQTGDEAEEIKHH